MMSALFPIIRPVLHAMDAEKAHKLTLRVLSTGLYPRDKTPDDPRLHLSVFGHGFPNPVGIPAGFDKNAQVLDAAFAFGIGFLEAGSVTPKPQFGNPLPRVFREPNSKSVINRMGMSNEGMDVFWSRYERFRQKGLHRHGIVGINIAKNKDTQDPAEDYLTLISKFGASADYLTVNISSPNTPGLRNLQGREILLPLLNSLVKRRNEVCADTKYTPLLIKLAPDLSPEECEDIAACVMEAGVDGLVLCNTTTDRPESLPADFREQTGGLSGPHVRAKSTQIIKTFYKLTGGRLPIIGVGGIASGIDAYEKIRAGATLVQLYTALVFQGPGLIGQIKRDLSALMDRDGFENITQAVGVDAK